MAQWLRRWVQKRRSDRGAAVSIGMVAGLIFFVTFLTAGIGAVQLARVHAALAQAAQSALHVEQNNGCWTQASSNAVAHTLHTAGVPVSGVQLTEDTGTLAPYGHAVDVGLKTQVHVSVFGISLAALPVSAGLHGTSFYAAGASGSAPTCIGGAGQSGPTITNVGFSQWTQTGATITISGHNLGASMPGLSPAPNGGHDSAALLVSQGVNAGYRAAGGSPWDSDGLHYLSWSSSQIVVQYPGNWPGGGGHDALQAGTPLTVTVWNRGLSTQVTVTPRAPTESVSLIPSTNTPYTDQPVTLTANANVAGTLSIVDASTGTTIKTCTNATTCATTVAHLTQNSAVSRNYQAQVSGRGSSGSSGTHTVTWNPVATIQVARWWNGTTNQTIGANGTTLPAGTVDPIWWSFQVHQPQATYQGWSQGWWNSPDLSGPSFQSTSGWLPTALGPGTYHIDLTFFFANGAIQEVVSPPVTIQ